MHFSGELRRFEGTLKRRLNPRSSGILSKLHPNPFFTRTTMNNSHWTTEFPGSIIVCDPQGIILEMNETAAKSHATDGGYELVGKNLLDCHPEIARGKVEDLLKNRKRNVYTIEKKEVKKLIYQSPWFRDGQYAGFVEFSMEIPAEMPHFIRT
jgi:transcriptional regulator with PAS, ATPase and Fis domain